MLVTAFIKKYLEFQYSGSQTVACISSTWRASKTYTPGPHPQSFWFSRSRVKPENLFLTSSPVLMILLVMNHILITSALTSELRVTLFSQFPHFRDENIGSERGLSSSRSQDDSSKVSLLSAQWLNMWPQWLNMWQLFSERFIS